VREEDRRLRDHKKEEGKKNSDHHFEARKNIYEKKEKRSSTRCARRKRDTEVLLEWEKKHLVRLIGREREREKKNLMRCFIGAKKGGGKWGEKARAAPYCRLAKKFARKVCSCVCGEERAGKSAPADKRGGKVRVDPRHNRFFHGHGNQERVERQTRKPMRIGTLLQDEVF